MKKNYKVVVLFLVVIMVFTMTACQSGEKPALSEKPEDSTKQEDSTQKAYDWPKVFIVNSTSSGSSAYAQCLAWATLLETDSGMSIRLMPEDSNNTKFRNVKNGDTHCMYDSITDTANLLQATHGFQTADGGPFPVRNLWIDNVQTALMVVRGDSDIQSIDDINEKTKLACWADPSMEGVIAATAAMVGCEVSDLNIIECSAYTDMIKMVVDGSAEVCPYITSTSSALIEAAAGPKGIKVLDFDPNKYPEKCAAWQTVFPTHSFSQAVTGYEGAIGKYGYSPYSGLWCSADLDTELVYNMTKYFIENEEKIVPTHSLFEFYWNLDFYKGFADKTCIPLHEGVIKYLEEIGQWDDKNADRQEYNVKLVDWYTDLYKEAIEAAKSKGITVGIQGDEWTNFWEQYKEDAKIPIIKYMSDEEISQALALGIVNR